MSEAVGIKEVEFSSNKSTLSKNYSSIDNLVEDFDSEKNEEIRESSFNNINSSNSQSISDIDSSQVNPLNAADFVPMPVITNKIIIYSLV